MRIVVDASMALAWLFERKKTKEAECAERMLLAMLESETFVPSLWHIEITNALLVGERRRVATEAQIIDYLNTLSELPITTDDSSFINHRDMVMALAREYDLSAYDATYLDLALRKNAMLATFDTQLAEAMRKAGGKIFN